MSATSTAMNDTNKTTKTTETNASADASGATEFAREANSDTPSLYAELRDLLLLNKKWWMLPILVTLALASLFVLAGGTVLAPFIYTLF